MRPMSVEFTNLLESTIQHLQELKANGIRFIPVESATLAALREPVAHRAEAALPAFGNTTPTASRVEVPALARSHSRRDLDPEATKLPTPLPSSPPAVDAQELKPPTAAVSPALSIEAKTQAFAELRDRALACVKCPNLVAARQNVVFGVGDIHAQLMFVGEAPGADEDRQGEPFVGAAGQLLTKIIQTMGLSRETVYIANILKCRPDTPGKASGNRKPTPEEMQTCLPYLQAQIDLIQPRVLVALGATAVEGLLGKTIGITRLRGTWKTYRDIPLMPTYHPAYLLRNQSKSEKRKVWEDMLQVMERLAMPITDKQRGYFLS